MNPANLIFPSVPHRCGAKKCSPAFLHLLQGHIWEYQISWILFWAIDMKSEFIVKRLQSFSILSLLYFFKFYRVTFCIIIIFFCLPFTNSFFRNDSFFIMLYYCLFMIIYFSVIHMGLASVGAETVPAIPSIRKKQIIVLFKLFFIIILL